MDRTPKNIIYKEAATKRVTFKISLENEHENHDFPDPSTFTPLKI